MAGSWEWIYTFCDKCDRAVELWACTVCGDQLCDECQEEHEGICWVEDETQL